MKLSRSFTAVSLIAMLLFALPAMADVVGRVTQVHVATRSVEIDGISYTLAADVQIIKGEDKHFAQVQLVDIKKGQFVTFKNRGATLTHIEVLAQEVDMPSTMPVLPSTR